MFKQQKRRERNPNARIKPFRNSLIGDIAPSYLTLKNDGSVGDSKFLFWSDNWLIDNREGEARRMKLHTENGTTYLLVEKGGLAPDLSSKNEEDESDDADAESDTDDGSTLETRPPTWHPGIEVYQRAGP